MIQCGFWPLNQQFAIPGCIEVAAIPIIREELHHFIGKSDGMFEVIVVLRHLMHIEQGRGKESVIVQECLELRPAAPISAAELGTPRQPF